jgi:hypothetical protein
MGSTPSRFPYDTAARDALHLASLRCFAIEHYASWISRYCRVVRLPPNSGRAASRIDAKGQQQAGHDHPPGLSLPRGRLREVTGKLDILLGLRKEKRHCSWPSDAIHTRPDIARIYGETLPISTFRKSFHRSPKRKIEGIWRLGQHQARVNPLARWPLVADYADSAFNFDHGVITVTVHRIDEPAQYDAQSGQAVRVKGQMRWLLLD